MVKRVWLPHASRSTYNLQTAIYFPTARNSQNAFSDFPYLWLGYNVGQLLHICMQKSKTAATDACVFTKNLNQPITQIACKNAA